MSLAFSADGRYLAAQGGAPDWSLHLWLWEKSKLVASARTATAPGHTAVQCLFQPGEGLGRGEAGAGGRQPDMGAAQPRVGLACLPTSQPGLPDRHLTPSNAPHARCAAGDDPEHISVVGEGTCALYHIEAGNALRAVPTALPRRECASFTCHAWLADNDAAPGALGLVVGTRRGEVLVVGEGEVRQALALEGGAAVEALAAHSRVSSSGLLGVRTTLMQRLLRKRGAVLLLSGQPARLNLLPLLRPTYPPARALWRAPAAARWLHSSATAKPSRTAWPTAFAWSRRAALPLALLLLPAQPLPPALRARLRPPRRPPLRAPQLLVRARWQPPRQASGRAAWRCAPPTRAWRA